jgi:DNA-binding CsgD family transcriptional regulator
MHHLSPREATLLVLAAMGRRRKEVAVDLECGLATVETHWRRIFKKTGTTTQSELFAAILSFALADPARRHDGTGGHGSSAGPVPRPPGVGKYAALRTLVRAEKPPSR